MSMLASAEASAENGITLAATENATKKILRFPRFFLAFYCNCRLNDLLIFWRFCSVFLLDFCRAFFHNFERFSLTLPLTLAYSFTLSGGIMLPVNFIVSLKNQGFFYRG